MASTIYSTQPIIRRLIGCWAAWLFYEGLRKFPVDVDGIKLGVDQIKWNMPKEHSIFSIE